jgi:hypothetical protein
VPESRSATALRPAEREAADLQYVLAAQEDMMSIAIWVLVAGALGMLALWFFYRLGFEAGERKERERWVKRHYRRTTAQDEDDLSVEAEDRACLRGYSLDVDQRIPLR